MNKKTNKRLLLFAFAVSGMTALIYEIVWSRPLQLIFGSTIYAVSTILTTFFIGFSLGSYAFRNKADNSKNPSALFGFIQLAIGAYGLIIWWLFKILPAIYLPIAHIPGIQFVQFLLLFFVLVIPATLFGATWPIMNKAFVQTEKIGKYSGLLYSFNSFGAFIGSIGAGFFLIPLLGIKNTSITVAVINLITGLLVLIYSKRGKNGA